MDVAPTLLRLLRLTVTLSCSPVLTRAAELIPLPGWQDARPPVGPPVSLISFWGLGVSPDKRDSHDFHL